MFGAIPLLIASGAGAESRRAIGSVVVYGVTFSLLLTLYIVPDDLRLAGREDSQLAGVHQPPDRAAARRVVRRRSPEARQTSGGLTAISEPQKMKAGGVINPTGLASQASG